MFYIIINVLYIHCIDVGMNVIHMMCIVGTIFECNLNLPVNFLKEFWK